MSYIDTLEKNHILYNVFRMKTVTINLPKELEEKIEVLVEKEFFPNKSELIRAAIRELLLKYETFE